MLLQINEAFLFGMFKKKSDITGIEKKISLPVPVLLEIFKK